MDMDDCSKTSAGAVAALPDDLLVEIISRVPAKSICRFKCVSKAWRDIIADPDHRKKLRQAMQGLFIMTPEETGHYFRFGFIDLQTAGTVPLDVDPSFSFMRERPGMHDLVLLDSCNGLILLGHPKTLPHNDELGNIDIVCNPTTKQWACVPICGSPDRFNHKYLVFDPAISSHFHLLLFQTSWEDHRSLEALHAYSSETGTWSHNQLDSQEEPGGLLAGWHRHVTLSYWDSGCAFVNGFLNLIGWDLDQERIVALDVQGKARRMIEVPGRGYLPSHLAQSQGCLHCVTKEELDAPKDNYKLFIWVLHDYDTQDWVLKNTVSSLDVFGDELTGYILDLMVVDIHQDCNVVFIFHYGTCKLMAYDMDYKELSVIATFEDPKIPFSYARYVPCFLESQALTS